MRSRFAVVAAVIAGIGVSALCAAQETAPPVTDPLLQQVGEDMARRDAQAANAGQSEERNVPAVPSAARSVSALILVIALILIVFYAARRWGKRVPLLAGSHLGKVLGRLYLDRGTALHFVQVGEKVLLIGVNANSISLIGEFAASGVHSGEGAPIASAAAAVPFNPDSFLAELRTRSQELQTAKRTPQVEEDEIANLRGDIQRLQRYLREENREHED